MAVFAVRVVTFTDTLCINFHIFYDHRFFFRSQIKSYLKLASNLIENVFVCLEVLTTVNCFIFVHVVTFRIALFRNFNFELKFLLNHIDNNVQTFRGLGLTYIKLK
jgi:hypothetical protein